MIRCRRVDRLDFLVRQSLSLGGAKKHPHGGMQHFCNCAGLVTEPSRQSSGKATGRKRNERVQQTEDWFTLEGLLD